jgi:hypothetical protein
VRVILDSFRCINWITGIESSRIFVIVFNNSFQTRTHRLKRAKDESERLLQEQVSLLINDDLVDSRLLDILRNDGVALIDPAELHVGASLGSGGFGTVYRGTFGGGGGVEVAIKQIPIESGNLSEFTKEVKVIHLRCCV